MPLRYEREDGYDSVEWAAKLPGSNGRVGMFGGSYHGNTQWMAAIEQPPSLAAMVPGITWSDALDGLFARGGAIELGITPNWTLIMGVDHFLRLPLSEQERAERTEALIGDLDKLGSDGYWGLPVNDLAVLRRYRSAGARHVPDPRRIPLCWRTQRSRAPRSRHGSDPAHRRLV